MTLETYEDYITAIETEALKKGSGDFRLAREAFQNATGHFEDGEPWFDLRMEMFLDWYLLDRPSPSGATPVEQYLINYFEELSDKERSQLEYFTNTLRSVFEIMKLKGSELWLRDIAGGGRWAVHSETPTVGFMKGDIIGTRIVYFDKKPIVGRGTVLHPRHAREAIVKIVARAEKEDMPTQELIDHLDKMRLKLDRYSNIRIQHVYRYPGDAFL